MTNNEQILSGANDKPISLYPSIMKACGVHEAVIVAFLQDALYFASGIDGDGDDFVDLDITNFEASITFLSKKELTKAIENLIKQEVILREGKRYRMNWRVLEQLREESGTIGNWK